MEEIKKLLSDKVVDIKSLKSLIEKEFKDCNVEYVYSRTTQYYNMRIESGRNEYEINIRFFRYMNKEDADNFVNELKTKAGIMGYE